MTDTRGGGDDPVSAAIEAAFESNINWSKIRSPFFELPIPKQYLPFLAQIALLWGVFEHSFESMFIALLAANNDTSDDWQRQSYEQKAKAFATYAHSCFASNEGILIRLNEILADAKALQLKRNLLLHGSLGVSFAMEERDGKTVPSFVVRARGRRKGRTVEEHFTGEALEDLAYDLAHLAGRMDAFNSLWVEGRYYFQTLSSQDKSFLRDFLSSYHPDRRTNPATPDDPLRSSQE